MAIERGIMKIRGYTKSGKEVVGWYFHLHNYPMRGDGITEGCYEWDEHDVHGVFPDNTDLANPVDWEGTIHRAAYRVIPEISNAAVATGRKDRHGVEIYGSKGKMQGGDCFRKNINDSFKVYWSEKVGQWITECEGKRYPLWAWREAEIEIITG